MSWPWSELGLSSPADSQAVKRAYAQRLKTTHPEEDPEGFQRLHEAYQAARRLARQATGPSESGLEPEGWGPVEEPQAAEERENPAEPEEEGFDYRRLFAEGSRERQEAQLRRAQERLEAARRRREEAGFQDAALESEEARAAALSALRVLDLLWDTRAAEGEWTRFLHSGTFFDAQHNLDFIFGLEDFLRRRPELPEEVKRRIFLAYRFFSGRPKAPYRGLYRLLLDSYRHAGRANAEIQRGEWERKKPFVLVGGFILLMMLISLLCQISEARQSAGGPPRSTGSADTAVSEDSAGGEIVRSSLEVPGSHDRSGEIDNDVPLEGGSGEGKTSFYGLVITYAAGEYPGLYAVSGRGTAENSAETFQWIQCTGQDAHMEELVLNYYLSADKKSFYCVPEGKEGETVEVMRIRSFRGIGIYRYVG